MKHIVKVKLILITSVVDQPVWVVGSWCVVAVEQLAVISVGNTLKMHPWARQW